MKAKEAEAARAAHAAPARAAQVPAPQGNATHQNSQTGVTRADLRGEVKCINGIWKVFCKHEKCQRPISYANWSTHCRKDHANTAPNDQDGNGGNEREPKKRYGHGKNNGTQKDKGAKANDSSNGKVAPQQKSKFKVAPKKKSQPD